MHTDLKALFWSKKRGKAEWIALLLYMLGISVVTAFHEPWFDEAQAWDIAKSASYQRILFEIPHYEGHPPLWHLLLSIFAKTGCPYEFSIKLVNVGFCTLAMALLILKSPFPKGVRCLLPFTYFLFYQYGVLSRPYCLVMTAFMLTAMGYTNRNAHPWRYILPLCFLCLTSAYGILVAGGLCLAWVIEIFPEMHQTGTLKTFWKDKRFWPLLMILILAMCLCLMILPADDCYYYGVTEDKYAIFKKMTEISRYLKLLYLPVEAWAGNTVNYSTETNVSLGLAVLDALASIPVWAVLISCTRKNHKFLTFILPTVIVELFFCFKYGNSHHIGMFALIHIFTFWIMMAQPGGMQMPEWFGEMRKKFDSPLTSKAVSGLVAGFVLIVPMIYSVMCSVEDIREVYCTKGFVNFIKENHLEDKKIMTTWVTIFKETDEDEDRESEWDSAQQANADNDNMSGMISIDSSELFLPWELPSGHPEIEQQMTNLVGYGASIAPYFDKNVIMNYNALYPGDTFMHYSYKEDIEANFNAWREQGLPEFILEWVAVDEVYGLDTFRDLRYYCIHECEAMKCFKASSIDLHLRIYLRGDLFDEYPQFHKLYN